MTEGVSFVVPVRNGAASVRRCLDSIFDQADGPFEVVVVDDGSQDDSRQILERMAVGQPMRVLNGPRRGAAAALNVGIRAAKYPIVCQIDQDVVIEPGWMPRIMSAISQVDVAAAQGCYKADAAAGWCVRATGLDLELRYARIAGEDSEHVCTGNTAYRADALNAVGLFDETLGYGYDNDISYRLRGAGYQLRICRDARSIHLWREGLRSYFSQQYGLGYGRLDVVAKHPPRVRGDTVSPASMMAHPLVMALAIVFGACAALGSRAAALASGALIAGLVLERIVAAADCWRRSRDPASWALPVLHLGRDAVWVSAIVVWVARRLLNRPTEPHHSMRAQRPLLVPLPAAMQEMPASQHGATAARPVLCLIPAHNEAANLPAVVAEVRSCQPQMDILVVDDGSTDDTASVLPALGVRWIRFPSRLGIGSAVRAGLRYASRQGYTMAVRIDGDGQHDAADIHALVSVLCSESADFVVGSRFTAAGRDDRRWSRVSQRALGVVLSLLTGARVTDPTSGFCALGPRAVALLAEHHPNGYGEPELRLFLSRNRLRVIEAPVSARPRLGGRTSLTPARLAVAAARVALAMVIVPWRRRIVQGPVGG